MKTLTTRIDQPGFWVPLDGIPVPPSGRAGVCWYEVMR